MEFAEYLAIDPHLSYKGQTVAIPRGHLLELIEANLERVRCLSGGFRLSPSSKQLESWGVALPLPFTAQQPGPELEGLRNRIAAEVKTLEASADYSIYIGVTGYAVGLFHIYCGQFGDSYGASSQLAVQCLHEAVTLLRSIEPHVRATAQKNHGIGFYCGVPGYLALRAAVERAAYLHEERLKLPPMPTKEGKPSSNTIEPNLQLKLPVGPSMHEPFVSELFKMETIALGAEMPDELLYSRAGYLYCLAFLQKHGIAVDDALIRRVIGKMFSSGVDEAKRYNATASAAASQRRWPLMWLVFGTKYLGAAHGVAGIAYMLLCWWEILKEDQKSLLLGTIEELAEVVDSGRFSEVLVEAGTEKTPEHWLHWCNGVPGITTLFCKAFLLTRSKRFLTTAEKCASLIWERGLLRKGTGLCHGVAGNAYSFLALYRLNQDHKYLYYALEFFSTAFGTAQTTGDQKRRGPEPADATKPPLAVLAPVLASDEDTSRYRTSVVSYVDPQREIPNCPDRPLSLMEGEMGVLCFLSDLLHPSQSHFPGFETSTNPPVSGEWLDRRYFHFACLLLARFSPTRKVTKV